MENRKDLLIFIPHPGHGHLVATLELANTHIRRDARFSAAILIVNPPFSDVGAYTKRLSASNPQVTFIDIPRIDPAPLLARPSMSGEAFTSIFIEMHRDGVREAVQKLIEPGPVNSASFIVDMFSTSMIDLADHFNFPTYTFFTSSASFLGFINFELTRPEKEFHISEPDLLIPSYANPVPSSVVPNYALEKAGHSAFVCHTHRIRDTKGIFINTFAELEPHALISLFGSDNGFVFPPVYPIGPILDLSGMNQVMSGARQSDKNQILKWLYHHGNESVVLLCFGSKGYFGPEQVKEIAIALERSGVPFLWSVRKPAAVNTRMFKQAEDFEGPEDPILPDGFISRIGTRGFVCGWVPQVEILAHNAIGGFVTHCGWNSILESIWFAVPMATWPLYAEQQLDSFDIVKNLGLGIELKMDYRREQREVVKGEDIEKVIRCLMDREDGTKGMEVRKRVKGMTQKSRTAVAEGGVGKGKNTNKCCAQDQHLSLLKESVRSNKQIFRRTTPTNKMIQPQNK